VSGPPCAGKSTYVEGLAEPGDIVVDMDLLASALTVSDDLHVYSNEVRSVARQVRRTAVSAALGVAASGVRVNVWIVHTSPSPDALRRYRVAGARVKMLDPGRMSVWQGWLSVPLVTPETKGSLMTGIPGVEPWPPRW